MVTGAKPRAAVLTALPEEYEAVRSHLVRLEKRPHRLGTVVEVGESPGCPWPVAIAEFGEGGRTAAALTERIVTWLEPEVLFFTGIAGGLKEDLALGDVVVAAKVHAYGGGKQAPDGLLARPESWPAAHALEQAARSALRQGESHWVGRVPVGPPAPDGAAKPPRVHFKPLASGDVLLNSSDCALRDQLHRTYNDAVAIEMESAGFAHAAHLAGCPSLAVRGISDRADGSKYDTDGRGYRERAAAHAAAAVMAVIAELARFRTTTEHSPAAATASSRTPSDVQVADALEDFTDMAGLEFRRNVLAMLRDRLALTHPLGIPEQTMARDHLMLIARGLRQSREPSAAHRALYGVMADLRPNDRALVRLHDVLGL
ncbi:5'-methylthioadenosine/S-adenosylhomocysteine nucleosidase [Streptomyces echinatus]|uniref:Nucleoside phosphorylase n=1 Tax=Streptomyces echinatus TaxID=67293 RepID=A0A7W9PZR9_9ACTN|nr:5'-methylthioadenosine/S-adenosylhomocysteine nucleosidase [Streptomyces echinatus]MBB5930986.1 nucleoside phosphorylase [Streptomyces echinatus]